MNEKIQKDEKKGIYFLEIENKIATLQFHIEENTFYIDYVQVPYSINGKGIGTQLVNEAVSEANNQNLKVVPICGFARYVIQKDD